MIYLISFFLCLVTTYVLIGITKKHGWVYRPAKNRWSKETVSLHGGVAIWFSFIFCVLAYEKLELSTAQSVVIACSSVMMAVGFYDDLHSLMPKPKLLWEIFISTIAISNGIVFVFCDSAFLCIALSYIWIIGICNAVNLIDNMDGASPGLTMITLVSLGFLTRDTSPDLSSLSLILAFCLLGFLVFNSKPAKVFMGDSGSLFLGSYTSMLLLIYSQTRPENIYHTIFDLPSGILLPALLIIVPIADTTFVTLNRLINHYPVSKGDRGHITHRLSMITKSDRFSVFFLYAFQLLICWIVYSWKWKLIYPLILLAATGLYFLTKKTNHLVWPKNQLYANIRKQLRESGRKNNKRIKTF